MNDNELIYCQMVEGRHFEHLINWKNGNQYHKSHSHMHIYSHIKKMRIRRARASCVMLMLAIVL